MQVVSGYSVGVVSMNAHDRLMIVGGDGGESNNIYFSDDCGISWNCYDGDQPCVLGVACVVSRVG